MSSTRERILRTLLERERCTIVELAEAVGINPVSVRHHLSKLEAEGLVAWEEERHGVGRPRRLYYLTEAGLEKFPSRYVQLTLRLLRQLKATLPQEMVAKLFASMARELALEYAAEIPLEHLSLEERLELVTRLLEREGFTVDWERAGDHLILRERTCPYLKVGQRHPEVCTVDQTLIATILEIPPEMIQCRLSGDEECAYLIPRTLTPQTESTP